MAFSRKRLFDKLKYKYRFVILDDLSFEEKASFKLNRLSVFVVLSLTSFALITLTIILIAFTSIREYIPGYADLESKKHVRYLVTKMDSLEKVANANEIYISNLNSIIDGKPLDLAKPEDSSLAQKKDKNELSTEVVTTDSNLKTMLGIDQMSSSTDIGRKEKSKFEQYRFFVPVTGVVVDNYSRERKQLGVGIAFSEQEDVFSVLDGVVLFAGFTLESGNLLVVQHSGGIITVYKNCGKLFKKTGTNVRGGELIAQTGGNEVANLMQKNLYFELWLNGSPLNPQEFINFR